MTKQVERITALETQVKLLTERLSALGLPLDPWVTPQDAATILFTSRGTIMSEIRRADDCRITNKPSDLKWGVHYRKLGANWQVNPAELNKVIFLPPEQRR